MSIKPCVYPRCDDGHGSAQLTTLTICEGCRSRYARLLRWLADDYAGLRVRLPLPVQRGARVRATSKVIYGHPAEWASDKARDIGQLLNEQEDGLREFRNDPPGLGKHSPERQLVARALEYFIRHFNDLCRYPLAGDTAVELNDIHHEIRAGLGRTKPTRHLPTPCPKCNLAALVVHPGDGTDEIYCQQCGHSICPEDYSIYLSVAADSVMAADDVLLDELDAMIDAYTPQRCPSADFDTPGE